MATKQQSVTITSRENKRSLLFRAVLGLGFTYVFAFLAVDSGSYWHYLLAIISFAIAYNAIGRTLKDIVKHRYERRRKH